MGIMTGVAGRAVSVALAGSFALALGLWLAGPQAIAVADDGELGSRGSGSSSAGRAGDRVSASATDTRPRSATRGHRPLNPAPARPAGARGTRTTSGPAEPQTRAAAAPPADEPARSPVVAIPQTPLVTALRLQEIPVLGPGVVAPIVTLVNRIPVVSDVLHPLLGYPLSPPGVPAPRDVRVISFDGTPINVHFMPATGLTIGHRAPTVFLAPALGTPGATNVHGTPFDLILSDLGGEVGVADLRNAGYNVVTWDPRGEYFSGGRVEIASPDFEARDVSAVIDWVAGQPEARLDGPGDPRMGMAGASYGGGVQLITAATDQRVDAIVPVLAWNSLISSLYKNRAFKTASATALASTLVLTMARMNPEILPNVLYGNLTGAMTPAGLDLLARSGPAAARGFPDLVGRITAPTLLIQGTTDTLTTLKEADLNARALVAQGVPTKVQWFCGGHGLCIHNVFDLSDGIVIVERTIEWLDRYVKGDPRSTGPAFEWVDQRGQHLATDSYPAPAGIPLVAERGSPAALPLVPFIGGSGPMFLVLPIGGTVAFNAVNLDTPVSQGITYIAGEPQLTLRYNGTGTGEHVYAQLVDPTTGLVIGNQVTPIPVTLDGQSHTVSIPLEPVAHTLDPGQRIRVQVFSWSAAHAASWSLGSLTVDEMRITLPTTQPRVVDPHRPAQARSD